MLYMCLFVFIGYCLNTCPCLAGNKELWSFKEARINEVQQPYCKSRSSAWFVALTHQGVPLGAYRHAKVVGKFYRRGNIGTTFFFNVTLKFCWT